MAGGGWDEDWRRIVEQSSQLLAYIERESPYGRGRRNTEGILVLQGLKVTRVFTRGSVAIKLVHKD